MIKLTLWSARACFCALLAAIAFQSLIAADSAVNVSRLVPWDKASHFLAHFALTLVGVAGFPEVPLIVLAIAIFAEASLLEAVQPYFGRTRDAYDMLANMIGILAVLAPIIAFRLREAFQYPQRRQQFIFTRARV